MAGGAVPNAAKSGRRRRQSPFPASAGTGLARRG